MMSDNQIAAKIAEKARDEWIKKAAASRVGAQVAERSGFIPSGPGGRVRTASPHEIAEHVRELNADADHAEGLAREWDGKAVAAWAAIAEDDFGDVGIPEADTTVQPLFKRRSN